MHQASVLNQKINNAYNRREADNHSQFNAPSYGAQVPYMAQPMQPQYAAPNQNGYPTYGQAMGNNGAFEPDDPIPDSQAEEAPDRKHRPRFVDFFMKKKSDDQ